MEGRGWGWEGGGVHVDDFMYVITIIIFRIVVASQGLAPLFCSLLFTT